MKRSAFINFICTVLITIILIIGVLLVMVLTGKLDLKQNKLIIASASHTITYDGKTLSNNKWSLMEGTLKEGHKLVVNVTGSQKNVGTSENYLSATVQDEKGQDVTGDYEIEYRPGILQVKPRELMIIAGSDMKLYDGTPLTCNSYRLQSSVALLPNDDLAVTTEGSIIEIGETKNVVTSATITSKTTGEDVTRNYNIQSKDGRLVIYDEATLVLESKSGEKYFDGLPLVVEEFKWKNGEKYLKAGHVLEIEYTGSQTLPGTSDNTFEVKIINSETNEDVTDTYHIEKLFGALIVHNPETPPEVTITSGSAEGEYGPNDLRNSNYTVEGLPDGFSLDMEAPDSCIPGYEYGEISNKLDGNIVIRDGDGNDVTELFELLTNEGTLSVDPPESFIPLFNVTMDTDLPVYLKQTSYGDYDLAKKKWKDAPRYVYSGPSPSVVLSPYYLIAAASKVQQLTPNEATITPLAGIFALPDYLVEDNTYCQYSDVSVTDNDNDPDNSYTVKFYTDFDLSSPSPTIASYEAEYASFVEENYTYIDDETKVFLDEYFEENDLDSLIVYDIGGTINALRTANNIAGFLRASILAEKTAGLVYNMDYNREMDHESNPTIAFLNDYKEGVCRHYAQAATMIFRYLNIPARYTVGFLGVPSAANEEFTIMSDKAHAWTEIYYKDFGWVRVEVTGSEFTPVDIKIAPKNTERLYDSSNPTLRPSDINVTGYGKHLWNNMIQNLGYTYEVEYSGVLSSPGKSETLIKRFVVKDESGEEIYNYSNGTVTVDRGILKIEFGKGNLHLYRGVIKVTSGSYQKTYGDDWDSALYYDYSFTCINGTWNPEDSFYAIAKAALAITPGTYSNEFVLAGANLDEYKFVKEWGELIIVPRSITIEAGSYEVEYNGESHVYKAELNTEGMNIDLAYEDYIYVCIVTSDPNNPIKNPGDRSYTNIIFGIELGEEGYEDSFKIYNKAGEDVTNYYILTTVSGTYTVVVNS